MYHQTLRKLENSVASSEVNVWTNFARHTTSTLGTHTLHAKGKGVKGQEEGGKRGRGMGKGKEGDKRGRGGGGGRRGRGER